MSARRAANLSDPLAPVLGMTLGGRTFTEFLILGGAILLVTGAVLVWVLVFRRSRRRTRLYHRHHRRTEPEAAANAAETIPGGRRRRRHRSRSGKSNWDATEGLPPARSPQLPPTDSR